MLRECLYGECAHEQHVRRTLTLTPTHTITAYSVRGNVVRMRIFICATRQKPRRKRVYRNGTGHAEVDFRATWGQSVADLVASVRDSTRYASVRLRSSARCRCPSPRRSTNVGISSGTDTGTAPHSLVDWPLNSSRWVCWV